MIEGTGGLLERVVDLVTNATAGCVRKEAMWVLRNITAAGTPYQVMSLVEHGAIDAFCSILNLNDEKTTLAALRALRKILKVGATFGTDYRRLVHRCGGWEKIDDLQYVTCDEVYSLAMRILRNNFDVEDDDETAVILRNTTSTTTQFLTLSDSVRSARSTILAPIKLVAPGDGKIADAFRAEEFVKGWTQQLLYHRATVQAASENTGDEVHNTILCDRISLSGESYSPDAAEVIASFLNEPFHDGLPISFGIAEVDLSNTIASQLTESGLKVLRTLCNAFADSEVVDANLSDNAIGEQGAGSCMTILKKPSLRRLSLCNNGLAAETMKYVIDILTKDECSNGCIAEKLTTIHFYNNMSGPAGCREFARILDKSKDLVDVRFSSTRAFKEGTDIFACALDACLTDGRNPNLKKLDLCDNNFVNKTSQEALFRALSATKHLTYLNLSMCELGDDGVEKVCGALRESNSRLKHLDLSANELTRRGAKHIADYIRDCKGLEVLRMEDNEITSKGVVLIAAAFHVGYAGSTIEELQLDSNEIGTKGARALIDAYGPDGKGMPNLKSIFLNNNSFTGDVGAELEAAFGDKMAEMNENDSDGEADDDLSSDDEEDDKDGENEGDVCVDNLADGMEKSMIV